MGKQRADVIEKLMKVRFGPHGMGPCKAWQEIAIDAHLELNEARELLLEATDDGFGSLNDVERKKAWLERNQ